MSRTETDDACLAVALETGLPVDWVRHHVDARAGRRGTAVEVREALAWVRLNVDRVRTLGMRREADAPGHLAEQADRVAARVERWRAANLRLWVALNAMPETPWREAAFDTLEREGRLTAAQEDVLRKMGDAAERRASSAPAAGSAIDRVIDVVGIRRELGPRGTHTVRVDFEVEEEGWRGRVEASPGEELEAAVASSRSGTIRVVGEVSWSAGSYAIVRDPTHVEPASTALFDLFG